MEEKVYTELQTYLIGIMSRDLNIPKHKLAYGLKVAFFLTVGPYLNQLDSTASAKPNENGTTSDTDSTPTNETSQTIPQTNSQETTMEGKSACSFDEEKSKILSSTVIVAPSSALVSAIEEVKEIANVTTSTENAPSSETENLQQTMKRPHSSVNSNSSDGSKDSKNSSKRPKVSFFCPKNETDDGDDDEQFNDPVSVPAKLNENDTKSGADSTPTNSISQSIPTSQTDSSESSETSNDSANSNNPSKKNEKFPCSICGTKILPKNFQKHMNTNIRCITLAKSKAKQNERESVSDQNGSDALVNSNATSALSTSEATNGTGSSIEKSEDVEKFKCKNCHTIFRGKTEIIKHVKMHVSSQQNNTEEEWLAYANRV